MALEGRSTWGDDEHDGAVSGDAAADVAARLMERARRLRTAARFEACVSLHDAEALAALLVDSAAALRAMGSRPPDRPGSGSQR
jgi:hypothetical protein